MSYADLAKINIELRKTVFIKSLLFLIFFPTMFGCSGRTLQELEDAHEESMTNDSEDIQLGLNAPQRGIPPPYRNLGYERSYTTEPNQSAIGDVTSSLPRSMIVLHHKVSTKPMERSLFRLTEAVVSFSS